MTNFIAFKATLLENLQKAPELVEDLKNKYSNRINSERRRECIEDHAQFLGVLEKRACFIDADFALLREIDEYLKSANVVDKDNKSSQNELVTDAIVESIGRNYREFARCLGVPDGEIFCIDEQYPTCVKSRIRKSLLYVQNTIPHGDKLYVDMIYASLKLCRRNDIKKKLDIILEK